MTEMHCLDLNEMKRVQEIAVPQCQREKSASLTCSASVLPPDIFFPENDSDTHPSGMTGRGTQEWKGAVSLTFKNHFLLK